MQNVQNVDRANFTSTFTVSLSYLIDLNVQRVVCGTSLENQEIVLQLNGVTVRGKICTHTLDMTYIKYAAITQSCMISCVET